MTSIKPEPALVGALLDDPLRADDVPWLKTSDFTDPTCQDLWSQLQTDNSLTPTRLDAMRERLEDSQDAPPGGTTGEAAPQQRHEQSQAPDQVTTLARHLVEATIRRQLTALHLRTSDPTAMEPAVAAGDSIPMSVTGNQRSAKDTLETVESPANHLEEAPAANLTRESPDPGPHPHTTDETADVVTTGYAPVPDIDLLQAGADLTGSSGEGVDDNPTVPVTIQASGRRRPGETLAGLRQRLSQQGSAAVALKRVQQGCFEPTVDETRARRDRYSHGEHADAAMRH